MPTPTERFFAAAWERGESNDDWPESEIQDVMLKCRLARKVGSEIVLTAAARAALDAVREEPNGAIR